MKRDWNLYRSICEHLKAKRDLSSGFSRVSYEDAIAVMFFCARPHYRKLQLSSGVEIFKHA